MSAVLQSFLQVAARYAQAWCQAKEACRAQGYQKCPAQHRSVHAHHAQQRQRDRSLVRKVGDSGGAKCQSQDRSRSRQHQGLREQLTDQPSASRPQSAAHGKFLAARCRSRQQQVREVDAHDQQNQADGAPQYNQRAPQLTTYILFQPRKLAGITFSALRRNSMKRKQA
jgi:hypothetical protein